MTRFRYRRPGSLAEAAAMFADAADPRYLAGGQTLLPTIRQRLAAPSDLIDLSRLSALRGIREEGGRIVIAAGENHAGLAAAPLVRATIPALAELAGSIGDLAVRNLGTLGGSVANNDPAADYPAALLALDATVVTDRREFAAEAFLAGLFATVLAEGEIVTAVAFRRPEAAAYRKLRNPASRYPMAGVFVARFPGGGVRVGVTGAGNDGAFRAAAIEAALAGSFSVEAIARIEADPGAMLADIHAPADYRAAMVGVMARRAVAAIA